MEQDQARSDQSEASPWQTKSLTIRWKREPLKCRGFLLALEMPFSPVHRARKFSTALGALSA